MVVAEMLETVNKIMSIGISEQKAKETIKNATLTTNLLAAIDEADKIGGAPPERSLLLYHLASKLKPQVSQHLPLLVSYIVDDKKLDSAMKVDAAIEFLLTNAHRNIDLKELDKECGVGLEITPEDIENAVESAIFKYRHEIDERRYTFNTGLLLNDVRNNLRWADFRNVKCEIDVQLLDLLGPKRTSDLNPPDGKIKKKVREKKAAPTVTQNLASTSASKSDAITIDEMISKLHLHKPGENFRSDGYVITPNTEKLIAQHLKETGGKVRTRFPPEPNGILHIGHAKAININFGYAAHHNGVCFLRFDDTNPEKEEEKFFKGIIDMVDWLGYKPYKITHSSDNFDQLYEWARDLIKANLAYVCHQKQEELKGIDPPPSPWRNRSIEENLLLFEDMKNGKMEEGECSLRMKLTLEEGKQDPVAYRIKYQPHVRSGNKWCIYPTYDYTHCLCDSIENITHSLCTKEFQSRRSAYYWLCNALNVYCPVQWEYGRLNMNYTVVSKRKITKLIESGIVKDWDDPRLFTLTALRRRGFPAEAINKFCAKMGVTGAQTVVDPAMLESCVRDVLNVTAPRTMVVLEPLEIEIVEGLHETELTVSDYPAEPEKSSHQVQLRKTIYIEKTDFRENAESGYKRLTKNQIVGLRYTPYTIKVVDIVYAENSTVISKVLVKAEPATPECKPKAFIHWVSNPINVTVRLYNSLFKHKNPEDPEQVPGGFLSDIAENSLIIQQAYADRYLLNCAKPFQPYQFERNGYFCIDPDSTDSCLIFNRTVSLKEDSAKN